MMKTLRYIIIFCAMAAAMVATAQEAAPSIRLLGVNAASEGTGQLKAKIDTAGKTIAAVNAITYSLLDGSSEVLADDYVIFDNEYIVAKVIARTSSYAYRLEVRFTDGSKVQTECVNGDNSEAFMWLTDFPMSSYNLPVEGEVPGVDVCLGDSALCLTGTKYFKGVSSRGGTIVYEVPADYNFRRLTTRLALQYGNPGSLQFRAYFNDASSPMGFTVSANNKYDFDTNTNNWILNTTYFPNLPITKVMLDFRANATKIANWLIPRLIMTRAESAKEAQTLTIGAASRQITYPQTLDLAGTCSSGGTIYYQVVRGAEAVQLNGSQLTFLDGYNTTVEVKAMQFGDDQWDFASASAVFDVQTGGKVFFTSALPAREGCPTLGFLSLNRRGRELNELKVQVFDNFRLLQPVQELDLLPLWQELTANCTTADHEHNVPFDFSEMGGERVFRVVYRFDDEETCYGPYRVGTDLSFAYLTDLPYLIQGGYNGATYIDKAFGGATMKLGGVQYNKGFGFHADGWVASDCALTAFERFAAVVGKNDSRSGKLGFTLTADNTALCERTIVNSGEYLDWDYAVPAGTKVLKITADTGGDGNGQDHVSIAAPRLFYKATARQAQSLAWPQAHEIVQPGECTVDLSDAVASSGLPVFFRIVEGAEFAEIVNENRLHIAEMPAQGEIVVEAFQPGDRQWEASEPALSRFRVARGVMVQKDERVDLAAGMDIEELIVYSDGVLCGQVDVPSGVVNVKRLKLRMSFVPGRWQSVCFPSEVDLSKISNLTELGYAYGVDYELKRYDSELSSLQPEADAWVALDEPRVEAMRGYLMRLEGEGAPVEVEFVIDNVQLDFESKIRMLNLTLDLSGCYADTQHNVYLKPANVKGNTLKVVVDYQPADPSATPVNHEQALADMRITYAPGHSGIRLVLPDASPARVAIYDASGRRLVKAVTYIAPNLIDLSDVPSGEYHLVIKYGPATAIRTFNL